jgi:alpha-glucosidase (family GH31 glycosyl hydrolase)
LWWIDPTDEDSLTCDSEFLIGDRILVAPVLEAGARTRDVYLPGKDVRWKKYQEVEVVSGRQWIRGLRVELDEIALFERVTT